MKKNKVREHFIAHNAVVETSLEQLGGQAEEVAAVLIDALRSGHKILAFGNGGSAAQASHFVGELLGRFALMRRPLPAITHGGDAETITCIANDFGYENLFARQIEALAQRGDVACGFTTSGRSANVIRALAAAGERGATTVALTGAPGLIGGEADYVFAVPSGVTAHVQEVHLMLLHVWCIFIDAAMRQPETDS